MKFTAKKIDLTFRIGKGNFGADGYDTVKLTGLRVQANIVNIAGSVHIGEAYVRVYGLTPDMLNQLSALNTGDMVTRKNSLLVSAGDDVLGMVTVFEGQINLGQIDMNSAPDTALSVYAIAGFFEKMQLTPPTSYPGHADAAIIMANLAAQMKQGFENHGVSVMLATPYFSGTLLEQVNSCAMAARITYVIDDGKLIIWPNNGSRGGVVPVISPESGMVGYPSYAADKYGLSVKTVFNPALKIGQQVQIKSALTVANGRWAVYNLEHNLDSQTPDGQWFTTFEAYPNASQ